MIPLEKASSQEDETQSADRQTASLAALVVVLLLVVVSLQLVHVLRASAAAEDCLLAGRRDCDALSTYAPPP